MVYLIFNYDDGEFLHEDERLLRFSSQGLAQQYMTDHYQVPRPQDVTKKTLDVNHYEFPFRIVRARIAS